MELVASRPEHRHALEVFLRPRRPRTATALPLEVFHDLIGQRTQCTGYLLGAGEVALVRRLVAVGARDPRGVVDNGAAGAAAQPPEVRSGVGAELTDERPIG